MIKFLSKTTLITKDMMNKNSILKDLERIAQAIYDKKGMNILVLDVRDICTMTDFFIIAEGTVDRHVKALSNVIMDEFTREKRNPLHAEGLQDGEWIVLDYGDFVIHLFTPELREKYALENLWSKGKIVDVKINIEHPIQKQK